MDKICTTQRELEQLRREALRVNRDYYKSRIQSDPEFKAARLKSARDCYQRHKERMRAEKNEYSKIYRNKNKEKIRTRRVERYHEKKLLRSFFSRFKSITTRQNSD